MSEAFTMDKVWEILEKLVIAANDALPGKTGLEKRDWVSTKVLALVELGDNFVPIIGAWADLPVIDGLEKWLVNVAVERAYVALKLPE